MLGRPEPVTRLVIGNTLAWPNRELRVRVFRTVTGGPFGSGLSCCFNFATAVVRAEVGYGDPVRQEYRDLWVLRLGNDGRCSWFEEWPFWPERPYHSDAG
jgi:hypothetical protein